MPDKRQVVHEFGDVLEIDGTHVPLKTNWEIVPITLMDCGRHMSAFARSASCKRSAVGGGLL
jgi:hypothetical protein